MKVIASLGRDDIAVVYIGKMSNGNLVEFVESVQPPVPREKKWVLIVSSLFGCPIGCSFCDAGITYRGKLSKEEILAQIDFPIRKRFIGGNIPVEKFKVQFARVGEPALNMNVIEVLSELPNRYNAAGLLPCVSTIAPGGSDAFFDKLLDVRKNIYRNKNFQLQFSIHTTNEELRDKLIPVKKWSFEKISEYGEAFFEEGSRKITLNFALCTNTPLEPSLLIKHFTPSKFLIKITPVNPTYKAMKNKISSFVDSSNNKRLEVLIDKLKNAGYEVVKSIGILEENNIGSNCGQYIQTHLAEKENLKSGYTYTVRDFNHEKPTVLQK
jgi:23S rRNA (adenine2503-C2)-methyltransferase